MSDATDQTPSLSRYDFFGEHTPARNRLPALESTLGRINDRFSRHLRSALLQHLRRGVGVLPAGIELLKHRELLERLEAPTYFTLVAMKPLRGTIALVFDARLVTGLVETRFGGTGRFPITAGSRDFTPFELKSMRRVIDTTLEQLVIAWEPFGAFEPEVSRHETNPQFAGFATAEDLIIVSTFDVTVDRGKGMLAVCIPYASIEPVHAQLMLGIVDGAAESDHRWSDGLRLGVERAEITLNVELGTIDISIADLVALRPGNVFEMARPEKLIVESGGVPLFRGRWGRYGHKIGVKIEERLDPTAEVLAEVSAAGHGDS
jgi:flagellar motor switch protein FliM